MIKVTIKDVAKEAGVATSTVSRVLSNNPKISDELKELIINNSKYIYNKLKCDFLVRIDYLYNEDENTLYFNEISAISSMCSLKIFCVRLLIRQSYKTIPPPRLVTGILRIWRAL